MPFKAPQSQFCQQRFCLTIRERDGGYCRFTSEGTMVDSFITLIRGVRPRDFGLAGSTRSHLICAARHSISHRLYSPLQSRGHKFCGVCGLACCRACGDSSIVVAVSGINRHSRSPTSPESKLSGPAECSYSNPNWEPPDCLAATAAPSNPYRGDCVALVL
jgi:hypothetical protein